jgi:hypothetical protein
VNCSAQASRTHPRSQRCAGSASCRGCQSNETVNSEVKNGRGKLCIPARMFPVCRSGTLASRSEFRARASAVEKSLTIVATSHSRPNELKTSSIGPFSSPAANRRYAFRPSNAGACFSSSAGRVYLTGARVRDGVRSTWFIPGLRNVGLRWRWAHGLGLDAKRNDATNWLWRRGCLGRRRALPP